MDVACYCRSGLMHPGPFSKLVCACTGGLGVNLQSADTCVLYDSDWNPALDCQARTLIPSSCGSS